MFTLKTVFTLLNLVIALHTGLAFVHPSGSDCHYNNLTTTYTEELIETYGENERLGIVQFRKLADHVRLSSKCTTPDTVHLATNNNGYSHSDNLTDSKCLTVDDVYNLYNRDGDGLTSIDLIEALSSLVYIIVDDNCVNRKGDGSHGKRPSSGLVWGYGIGFVTLVCVISNIGGLLGPLMEKEFFQKLLTFLVAMAVGTLAATGLLVLLPEAFDLMRCDEIADDYLWKSATAMAGIYIFYLSERILKILFYKPKNPPSDSVEIKVPLSTDHGHGHSHFPGNTLVESGQKTVSTVAWMVLIGDALHNFVDGLSIGAAFTENIYTGVSVSIAVVCEELPHELGDIAILLHSGLSMKRALLYNFLAAVICYVGLIIGILLGENTSANRWIFAIAGGLFLYVSLVDMLPELSHVADEFQRQKHNPWKIMFLQIFGLLVGFGIILVVAFYASQIVIDG
ncbi:metal cation symporter ZIP8 [Patella vulgata]|uniref:metal cation symporter ZIP8 n=1 Tax=Patella vulgata TaxID=6465 RepID=UPI0021806590|nr:metal cation symporter ZIP8 [Patella vulgata]